MVTMPESMDECFYFTNRTLEEGKGNIIAWVYKPQCPECKKVKMGKPVDPKTGKVKSRAEIYVCPGCGHEENKEEYDPSLSVEVQYKCPHCSHEGETTTPYQRKSFQGVKAYIFNCDKCNEKIGITKKMKLPKKK